MRKLESVTRVMVFVCFGLLAHSIQAQTTISGRVVSLAESTVLPGVNVVVKGTTQGTTTDENGQYKIVANEGDILVFSFIGFLSEEVKVSARTSVDVTLSETLEELMTVVVVGYSEKKKSQITGAISNLSADDLKGVTGSSVEYMLQGKVAGVQVSNSSGAPGSSAEIKIRGTSSVIAERPPLFVVDGIIGGTYNPNDVESLTVLKDAGAVALYGSRANNGVIIITTKRGSSQKLKIDYKTTFGNREISTGHFKMMNSTELFETERKMFSSSASFKSYRKDDLRTGPSYDWLNLAYHRGTIMNHNLAVSQKLDKVGFYLAADYYKEQGTLLSTGYDRLNVRSNFDFQLSERVKLTTNLNVISDQNKYPGEWQWTYSPYLYLPYDSPYDAAGNLRYLDGSNRDNWLTRDPINVLHNAEYNSYKYRSFQMNADATLTVAIIPGLDFQSRNRVSHYSSRDDKYQDVRTVIGRSNGGIIEFNTGLSSDVISTNLVKFSKEFANAHHLNGFVGFEASSGRNEGAGAIAIGIAPGLTVPQSAATATDVYGTKTPGKAMSFFTEVSYDFKEKYFLSASYRRDGSSLFGKGNRWGSFPAVSAAWLISGEQFMSSSKALSFLKLRGSYGVIGNDNIGPFKSLAIYNFGAQYGGVPAGYSQTLPNEQLSWEATKTYNIGVDVGIFKKIDISVDAFQKVTDKLLLNVQLPTSQGFEEALRNSGTVSNKGVELSIGGDVITRKKFKWNTSFNIGSYKNTVDRLPRSEDIRRGGEVNQLLRVGENLESWYMPKWVGVDPATGNPQWEHLEYDTEGHVSARSVTGDYHSATYQIVGTATPKFFGGLTNTLSYGGFSLSATASFQQGNKVYHRTREFVDSDGAYFGFNLMKLDDSWKRWENPGDIATHPRVVFNGNNLSNKYSSRYLEDGSYLRIRNITFAYQVPAKLLSRVRISSARFFVSGDNLVTLTKFTGLDPEVNSFANTNYYEISGVSDFKYPINKQYLAGFQLSF
jgi:TonB-linked SusC/RagA family outer membrane protein